MHIVFFIDIALRFTHSFGRRPYSIGCKMYRISYEGISWHAVTNRSTINDLRGYDLEVHSEDQRKKVSLNRWIEVKNRVKQALS